MDLSTVVAGALCRVKWALVVRGRQYSADVTVDGCAVTLGQGCMGAVALVPLHGSRACRRARGVRVGVAQ